MPVERDPPANDPDVIAGELAIGLLEGTDRAAALRTMLSDQSFARRVDAWRERLAPLNDAIPELMPPQRLWSAIERRLSGSAGGDVRIWRAATAGATALAAALLAVVVLRAPQTLPAPAPAPQIAARPAVQRPALVAQLGAPAATALLAVYQEKDGSLIVRPAVVDANNQDAELWVIPKGGKPVSLGLIARDRPTRIVPGARKSLLMRDAVLAVSLEPIGGSPTGQPTGPVVAMGTLSAI